MVQCYIIHTQNQALNGPVLYDSTIHTQNHTLNGPVLYDSYTESHSEWSSVI
jgi:hypothetical protein